MPIETTVHFLDVLRSAKLLSRAQLEAIDRDLRPRFAEPRALAKELMTRGWLTPYQVNQLFQEHGKDLVLGPYVLLERLGEGGMGAVFKAKHQKLDKIVALKVIRKDRLANPQGVRRFHREIQAAAQLSHPNIVHAYDADEVGGTHFFAMEYVEGIDLAKLLKQRGLLPVEEACEYIRQAALGLQHAYEHGLVHRDIKPGNLLLTTPNRDRQGAGSAAGPPLGGPLPHGRGSEVAVVKLLDMGLARLNLAVEDDAGSELTQTGMIMGTPDYIAPEQAVSSHEVDIRADIYSLGCTLYHLLTGKVPFPGGTFMQKIDRHRWAEPTPLEQLRPEVPPDVGEIVRMMMAKKPEERFQVPAEVAEALTPFCPGWPGQSGAMPRTPQRRGVEDSAPATPVAAAPVPAIGLGGDTEPPQSAETAPPAAAPRERILPWTGDQRGAARRLAIVVGISSAVFVGIVVAVIVLLSSRPGETPQAGMTPPERGPGSPPPAVTVQVEANKLWQDTGVEVQANMPITIRIQGQWKMGPDAASCAAEGLAKAPSDRNVLPDAPAMCLLARIGNEDTPSPLRYGSWFPRSSGRLFLQANDLDLEDNSGSLTLQILNTARKEGVIPSPPLTSMQAADLQRKKLTAEAAEAFKPLAARDAKADPEQLRKEVLAFRIKYPGTPAALRAAELLMKLPSPLDQLDPAKIPEDAKAHWRAGGREPPVELVGVLGEHRQRHWAGVYSVAFSPDGKTVASASADGIAYLRDAETLRERLVLRDGSPHLAFSPDGQLVVNGTGGHIIFRDARTGQEIRRWKGAFAPAAFSRDGARMATCGDPPHAVQIWDVKTGQGLRRFEEQGHQPNGVAFTPDGRLVLSAGHDGTLRWWDVDSGKEVRRFAHREAGTSGGHFWSVAVSADGRRAVSGDNGQMIRTWNVETGAELRRFPMPGAVVSVAFSPDGRHILSGNQDGIVRLTDAETGKELRRFEGHGPQVRSVAFSPDGRRAVSGGDDGTVRLWDVESGKEVQPLTGHVGSCISVALSRDDRWLYSSGGDAAIRMWDVAARKEERVLRARHAARWTFALLSPDGQHVLSGYYQTNKNDPVVVWDAASGTERKRLEGRIADITAAAFSPDGRQFLIPDSDGSIKRYESESGREVGRLQGHTPFITGLAYTPDGRFAFSGSTDMTARLWDVDRARELHRFDHQDQQVSGVAVSPDGSSAYTGTMTGTIRRWRLSDPRAQGVALADSHIGQVYGLVLSADGCWLATSAADGRVILWDTAAHVKLRDWQLSGPVYGLAFASDGRHLATANGNGTVYILRLGPPPKGQ